MKYINKSIVIIFVIVVIIAGFMTWNYRGPLARMAGWPFLPKVDPPEPGVLRFAAIGDYGSGNLYEGDVAKLVKSWKPEFIVTLGDNFYQESPTDTMDSNIGQFYHEYIYPYKGKYGKGADSNKFFPIPGHTDWDAEQLKPYLDFFTLPGNERYYDIVRGPVHLFMLDTDERDPDGATVDSIQANWLKEQLAKETSHWKIVLAHHAPYTSHRVEDIERMRWPFAKWGADAVLSGFYHVYERLSVDGIPYIINGAGGQWVSDFGEIDPHSQFRYNLEYGALIIEADSHKLKFIYVNRKGKRIDQYTLEKQ